MRKLLNRTLAILAAGLMLTACEKNSIPELADPLQDGALVKFFFHVDGAPRSNFYLNSEKVTGVSATTDGQVLGNAYGSVYPSNAYAILPAGSFTLSAIDTMAVGGSADVLATTEVTLENDKNYSVYLAGTTEDYETFMIEDKLPPADNSTIWWRFVNTMAEMPFNVDVYAVRGAIPATDTTPAQPAKAVLLGADIDFKGHGEYVQLEPGSYTFKVYPAGSGYDPLETEPYLSSTVVLASLGRVYTTQIRGTYSLEPNKSNIDYWRDR
ncbi:DUF4397 domain-containing protein [Pontibacter mangrovi]|uniref:DUF4397 domain-containing protein n=1 Tax=Pontibacter mangrovi TaxID=2589816 RepID=A0A501WD50_9BACT|nr:DUF4397 domain-containing protein [Pontibacter mangrovi]TPE46310.1 DUF4397 domain-containing protein [Pontibacter mangrovi]